MSADGQQGRKPRADVQRNRAAVYGDTLDALGETLPWIPLYIAVMTHLLLFLAFGSVLLPLKAIAMNMLSLKCRWSASCRERPS
ncbi:hypothetical protein ACIRD9_21560 [Streptomyces violaceus]|jgi:uncharacterized membrane protein YdfJ with MMPL/SSD domain|uniref:hypothetical protein n=1 Tax=Streptomyces violaceus TaxID=1936 RepID=UPI0037FD1121